ncbi:hypothetical protein [Geothrix oryzisoli]|uniref:hypothetical protein n=1 Tax=Geothrix oryzisoli TaxID=2922721 RepID=UPI001FAB539B|nr:hypothetical protein [Geothrix oryzisoli]
MLMLAILLGVVGGCSKKPLPPPNGWKVAQFPVWDDLRHADTYLEDRSLCWAVSMRNGTLEVRDYSDHLRGEESASWEKSGIDPAAKAMALNFGKYLVEVPPQHALSQLVRVSDGWLVGFNAGEWSGGLCWVSSDGSKGKFLMTDSHLSPPPPPPPPPWAKLQKVDKEAEGWRRTDPNLPGWIPRKQFRVGVSSSENVRILLKHQDDYLAFEGLAHMSLDMGKVVKISRDSHGEWFASDLIRLGSEPKAVSNDGPDAWIVITNKTLTRFDASGKVTVQLTLPDALSHGPVAAVVPEFAGSWLVLTTSNLYRVSEHGTSRLLMSGTRPGCGKTSRNTSRRPTGLKPSES